MSDPTTKIRKNARSFWAGQHHDPDAFPMLIEKWCDEADAELAALRERVGELEGVTKALMCATYFRAYHHGHHDTVEGVYTDVYQCDQWVYWRQEVDEIFGDSLELASNHAAALEGGGDDS